MKQTDSRLSAIDPSIADGDARALLDRMLEKTGITPALLRVMARSPAVLDSYLAMQERLDEGRLDKRLRYQIALAVSQTNGSAYCVAAFSALGKTAGLSDEAMRDARAANSPDRRTDAALKFAEGVASKAEIAGALLSRLRAAGFREPEIVEIVAQATIVGLANAIYHISDIPVDFPPVDLELTGP